MLAKLIRTAFHLSLIGCVLILGSPQSEAGNIYLNGHDILLHDGQAGYDSVILDYLRCAGTPDETPAASYSIAVLGSGVGQWGWSDVPGFNDQGSKPGYASTTYYDTNDLISSTVSWATVLSHDVLVILSHTSCGGCDMDSAGVAEINANSAAISTAFNGGMDLWVNSGASEATYYNFLPPAFATSGPSISGSSGFVATPAGASIGIVSSMINGYATHNRFDGFSSALTVMEVRPTATGLEETIALGAKNITLGCLDISNETILCDPDVPGKYIYTFDLTNNSGLDAEQIKLFAKDQDGDGAPDFSVDPDTFTTSLPDGATVTLTTCVEGVAEGAEICFEIWLLTADFEQCCVQCHCTRAPDCCHTILDATIDCVAGATGEWIYTFNLQNNASYPIDRVFLWPAGSFSIAPNEFLLSPIPSGGTTGTLSVVISGASAGDVVCFDVSIHNSMTSECCSGGVVCVTLPDCDGCDVPDRCHVPPMTAMCFDPPGTPFITGMFTLTICNNCTDEPTAFEYSFEAASDADCPTPYVSSADFSPSSGITPVLGLGECIEIPITVTSDLSIFPGGECSCFHVHVLNLTTGILMECEGKLRAPDSVTAKFIGPDPLGVAFPEIATLTFEIEDFSGSLDTVDFELLTDTGLAPIASVGGLAPGTSLISSVLIDSATGTGTVSVEARFTDHEPFVFYDIILMVAPGGGGGPLEAVDSQAIRSVIPADCNANGVADDIDIILGTSLDVDGDGVPDECTGGTSPATAGPAFIRGDSNNDGSFNVGDVVHVLTAAFEGAPTSCTSAADANDDGMIDISDPITMLEALFGTLGDLPGPFPSCDSEITPDALTCEGSSCE